MAGISLRTLLAVLTFAVPARALGRASSVLTDAAGARFSPRAPVAFGPFVAAGTGVLVANYSAQRQRIHGFGSALTEAAAFNFAALSPTARAALVELLWAPPPAGNGYSAGRLHMNSADFALSTYSLDDTPGDFSLAHFDDSLVRDNRFVLPLARAARVASNGALNLFFSPWSPPAWLKRNDNMIDSAHPNGLLPTPDAQRAWANYFVRFAKALARAGVPVWGATLQNEPLIVMQPSGHHYEACSWTADAQAAWARDYLAPAVRADPETRGLVLLGYDWNRGELTQWVGTYARANATAAIDGFAVHWYNWGSGLELSDLANAGSAQPGVFILATEACLIKKGVAARGSDRDSGDVGSISSGSDGHGTLVGRGAPPGNGSVAYTYASGELYALDLIGDLHFGVSGWVDWNAVLDYTGGPNHINRSDIGAPILVDAASDSFYVQSPYYYVGHVSRFAPPGAIRVACGGEGFAGAAADFDSVKDYIKPQISGGAPPAGAEPPLVAACFATANGTAGAVVVMNAGATEVASFTLSVAPRADGASGGSLPVTALPAHSITTFTFALRL